MSLVFIIVLSYDYIYKCFAVLFATRDGPWEAFGDAWGIIDGLLAHWWRIFDKTKDKIITCDPT